MSIEFCGCKNRCAEEDGGYTRPNDRGICEANYVGLTPEKLADEIFLKMSPRERATAIKQGAANMEGEVKKRAPNWSYSAIETCLDKISWHCINAMEEQ